MMNKAQKIGKKRQLRSIKAKNHQKAEKERDIHYSRMIAGIKKKEKVKKVKLPAKPYRLVRLQAKHDRIYQSVRNAAANSEERNKLLGQLSIIKKKLGQ